MFLMFLKPLASKFGHVMFSQNSTFPVPAYQVAVQINLRSCRSTFFYFVCFCSSCQAAIVDCGISYL